MYIDTNKVTKIYLSLFHVVEQLGLIPSRFLDQRLSLLLALQHLLCLEVASFICSESVPVVSIPCSSSLLMEQDLWTALQVSGSRMCK